MLLPETQTLPMARIQVAKDLSMARTLAQAVQPGKEVVLMAGAGHVERSLGVPVHLPSTLAYQAVRLRAGGARPEDKLQQFHAIWETPAVPPKDYCAGVIPKRNP